MDSHRENEEITLLLSTPYLEFWKGQPEIIINDDDRRALEDAGFSFSTATGYGAPCKIDWIRRKSPYWDGEKVRTDHPEVLAALVTTRMTRA